MVQIRTATLADAQNIVQMQVLMAWESEKMTLDPTVVQRGVEAILVGRQNGRYLLAQRGEEILGVLLLQQEWSDWRDGMVVWIHSVYVSPAARGQGIYRTLYEYVQAEVQKSPMLRGIRLYVDKGNTSAQQVYDRLGMESQHYALYEWMKS